MTKYAENTSVNVERSKAEIERTLQRYGADQFMSGWDQERAVIGFTMSGRQVRFILELPDKDSDEFWTTETGRDRSESAAFKSWEQSCRQRWRALALVIKAKLEAVESGITVFEDEFLAHIVLPNGSTVGQWITPQIEKAYETLEMPQMIPALMSGESQYSEVKS